MSKKIKKYFKVWQMLATNELQQAFINRGSNILFLIGKAFRFGMMLLILLIIRGQTQTFASYTTDHLLIFFLTYNFIDLLAQVFFRGVYIFRPKVNQGQFDFDLAKPVNPLFRALLGKPDINDTIFIIPVTLFSIWLIVQLQLNLTINQVMLFVGLLMNGFLIATAFHILVLCLGILTMEVDNTIMLYRDLSGLARFPIDIYLPALKTILLYLVPVGLMVTVPAQVLLNLPPSQSILFTTGFGLSFFLLSLQAWRWSLKRYSSASS